MTAKISATSAAEPKADKRPISTPVPVAVFESDVVGYVCVKVLRLVLVLALETRRLLVKVYARLSLFRRERWLDMTDMVIGGGGVVWGGGEGGRTDKLLWWFREGANVGRW